MAEKHPDRQADTASAMHHRLSTAQRNYHSIGVQDAKKARLTRSLSEALMVSLKYLNMGSSSPNGTKF